MAELTDLAMEIALDAIFTDASLVALTRNGEEITDAGYQRVSLNPTAARAIGTSGVVAKANSEELRFGPWAVDAPDWIDGWAVLDADGEVLARGKLGTPQKPGRGHDLVFPERRLVLGLR